MKTKNIFFAALLGILSLNSCKRDASTPSPDKLIVKKDYEFYKNNLSNDPNFVNFYTASNEGIANIEALRSNSLINIYELRKIISNIKSKEQIEKRVNHLTNCYKIFIKENPNFEKLTKDQKTELMLDAFNKIESKNEITNPLQTLRHGGWGCVNGFNSMANSCKSSYNMDLLAAAGSAFDPIAMALAGAHAWVNYGGCLDSAADAMDVCIATPD